jgi:hypothetical protein
MHMVGGCGDAEVGSEFFDYPIGDEKSNAGVDIIEGSGSGRTTCDN